MPINVAILGSGIFAREEHLPAILSCPLLSLRAIYSRSLQSAQTLLSAVKSDSNSTSQTTSSDITLYSDETSSKNLAHLLQDSTIQAVVIALPILVQPDVIKQALAAGKHVLAEKPIAKDVATAEELLKYYEELGTKATFSIAENFRFLDSFTFAASHIPKLGRLLNFRVRVHSYVKPGGKYYETAWRKKPEYQGGFLLDGGVHSTAATRLLLDAANNPDNAPARISAYTNLLQEHLPPIDTVDSTWRTKSGATGTYSQSFGTTMKGSEYVFAFEKGTILVSRSLVIITGADGTETKEDFPNEGSGVKQEIKGWAEALEKGKPDPRQSPQEAIKDLALIEAMIQSGEKGGSPVDLAWA